MDALSTTVVLRGIFVSMRAMSGRKGHLTKLGIETVSLPDTEMRSLRRWECITYVIDGCCSLGLVIVVAIELVLPAVAGTSPVLRQSRSGAAVGCTALSMRAYSQAFILVTILVTLGRWLYSLKVAGALARDRVLQACQAIEKTDETSPEWEVDVVPKMQALQRDVFPTLSNGWAGAMGAIAGGALGLIFSCYIGYVNSVPGADDHKLLFVVYILTHIGNPLLIGFEAASANTSSKSLLLSLNRKRLSGNFDSTGHLRVVDCEMLVKNANKQQGMGFVLFEVVLTAGMLQTITTALVTGLGIVLPYVLASATPQPDGGDCQPLSDEQADAVLALVALLPNNTCLINGTELAALVQQSGGL